MYEERKYRNKYKGDNLVFFDVCVKETDLRIGACRDLSDVAKVAVERYRSQIEEYVSRYPLFLTSLEPVDVEKHRQFLQGDGGGHNPGNQWDKKHSGVCPGNGVLGNGSRRDDNRKDDSRRDDNRGDDSRGDDGRASLYIPDSSKADTGGTAEIIRRMAVAARIADVGPMAAVAGAISELVGYELLKHSNEVIVENGGDIFIATDVVRTIGIYAGKSPFCDRLAIKIRPEKTPLGICTSSGTVGHSLSFGKADAAVVISKDTFLADAAATALGNRVAGPDDIESALGFASSLPGVERALVIIGDKLGAWGDIELVEL